MDLMRNLPATATLMSTFGPLTFRSRKAARALDNRCFFWDVWCFFHTICWTNDTCESCRSLNGTWAPEEEWKREKSAVFNLDGGIFFKQHSRFDPQNKITSEQTRLLRPALERHPLQVLWAIFQTSVVWRRFYFYTFSTIHPFRLHL